MNLKIYLATINMKVKDFSELLECDPRYMSRIMNGRIHPGKRLAKAIEEMTDGQVKFEKKPKKKQEKENEEANHSFSNAGNFAVACM